MDVHTALQRVHRGVYIGCAQGYIQVHGGGCKGCVLMLRLVLHVHDSTVYVCHILQYMLCRCKPCLGGTLHIVSVIVGLHNDKATVFRQA